MTQVRDVLINEGLRRWDVRYYLAVLYFPCQGEQRLEIAYEVGEDLSSPRICSRLAHYIARTHYPGFQFYSRCIMVSMNVYNMA